MAARGGKVTDWDGLSTSTRARSSTVLISHDCESVASFGPKVVRHELAGVGVQHEVLRGGDGPAPSLFERYDIERGEGAIGRVVCHDEIARRVDDRRVRDRSTTRAAYSIDATDWFEAGSPHPNRTRGNPVAELGHCPFERVVAVVHPPHRPGVDDRIPAEGLVGMAPGCCAGGRRSQPRAPP